MIPLLLTIVVAALAPARASSGFSRELSNASIPCNGPVALAARFRFLGNTAEAFFHVQNGWVYFEYIIPRLFFSGIGATVQTGNACMACINANASTGVSLVYDDNLVFTKCKFACFDANQFVLAGRGDPTTSEILSWIIENIEFGPGAGIPNVASATAILSPADNLRLGGEFQNPSKRIFHFNGMDYIHVSWYREYQSSNGDSWHVPLDGSAPLCWTWVVGEQGSRFDPGRATITSLDIAAARGGVVCQNVTVVCTPSPTGQPTKAPVPAPTFIPTPSPTLQPIPNLLFKIPEDLCLFPRNFSLNIILDGSRSIADGSYIRAKQWAADVVNATVRLADQISFRVSSFVGFPVHLCVRTSVTTFAVNNQIVWNLTSWGECLTVSELPAVVATLLAAPRPDPLNSRVRGTHTADALHRWVRDVYQHRRENESTIVLMATDGLPKSIVRGGNQSPCTSQGAAQLQNTFSSTTTRFFLVGIGFSIGNIEPFRCLERNFPVSEWLVQIDRFVDLQETNIGISNSILGELCGVRDVKCDYPLFETNSSANSTNPIPNNAFNQTIPNTEFGIQFEPMNKDVWVDNFTLTVYNNCTRSGVVMEAEIWETDTNTNQDVLMATSYNVSVPFYNESKPRGLFTPSIFFKFLSTDSQGNHFRMVSGRGKIYTFVFRIIKGLQCRNDVVVTCVNFTSPRNFTDPNPILGVDPVTIGIIEGVRGVPPNTAPVPKMPAMTICVLDLPPVQTANPTVAPTRNPTKLPSTTPTRAPSQSPTTTPTKAPSGSPSLSPSKLPSVTPTRSPSRSPSTQPTLSPSVSPTKSPSKNPTTQPSLSPSDIPTISPTNRPTTSPSERPSTSPTISPSESPSTTPSRSPSTQPTLSPTQSPSKFPTKSPSGHPSASPSRNPSASPSRSPSSIPSSAPSTSPTSLPTMSPSKTPSMSPTRSPSFHPTLSPSNMPTLSPTKGPSMSPSGSPSVSPSKSPTMSPSNNPSGSPSTSPTKNPSTSPSASPSSSPSQSPSGHPTKDPSLSPSSSPSRSPSLSPTLNPTDSPSQAPTRSPSNNPSMNPTDSPTKNPSVSPTDQPTSSPSDNPSLSPSMVPSGSPTKAPTRSPSSSPSVTPTKNPSRNPSVSPTQSPSQNPSITPTKGPSSNPSISPSKYPSGSPTFSPTGSPTLSPTVCRGPPPDYVRQNCLSGANCTSNPVVSVDPQPSVKIVMSDYTEFCWNYTVINPVSGPCMNVDGQHVVGVSFAMDECCPDHRMDFLRHVSLNNQTFDRSSCPLGNATTAFSSGCVRARRPCSSRTNSGMQCTVINVNNVMERNGTFCLTVAGVGFDTNNDSRLDTDKTDRAKFCFERGIINPGSPNFCSCVDVDFVTSRDICQDTHHPTTTPSRSPSKSPSTSPSDNPSTTPTRNPTDNPSSTPSSSPSKEPTGSPSSSPSKGPSMSPSKNPSLSPSNSPSGSPTSGPTGSPSLSPTTGPSKTPSAGPTYSPSNTPTSSPSSSPSRNPSLSPVTSSPSDNPSLSPSRNPSTAYPSRSPTAAPSTCPKPPMFKPSMCTSKVDAMDVEWQVRGQPYFGYDARKHVTQYVYTVCTLRNKPSSYSGPFTMVRPLDSFWLQVGCKCEICLDDVTMAMKPSGRVNNYMQTWRWDVQVVPGECVDFTLKLDGYVPPITGTYIVASYHECAASHVMVPDPCETQTRHTPLPTPAPTQCVPRYPAFPKNCMSACNTWDAEWAINFVDRAVVMNNNTNETTTTFVYKASVRGAINSRNETCYYPNKGPQPLEELHIRLPCDCDPDRGFIQRQIVDIEPVGFVDELSFSWYPRNLRESQSMMFTIVLAGDVPQGLGDVSVGGDRRCLVHQIEAPNLCGRYTPPPPQHDSHKGWNDDRYYHSSSSSSSSSSGGTWGRYRQSRSRRSSKRTYSRRSNWP